MKEVFSHADGALVGLCKSLLDEAGLACHVSESASLLRPVLSVLNDADYAQARAIVDSYRLPLADTGPKWICPHCHTSVPAAFDSCWKCERERADRSE